LTEGLDGQLQPSFQSSTESFYNKAASRRCCPSVRTVALWLYEITIISLGASRPCMCCSFLHCQLYGKRRSNTRCCLFLQSSVAITHTWPASTPLMCPRGKINIPPCKENESSFILDCNFTKIETIFSLLLEKH
jgi:hypothetical protein